jgi:hypothetical protein
VGFSVFDNTKKVALISVKKRCVPCQGKAQANGSRKLQKQENMGEVLVYKSKQSQKREPTAQRAVKTSNSSATKEIFTNSQLYEMSVSSQGCDAGSCSSSSFAMDSVHSVDPRRATLL